MTWAFLISKKKREWELGGIEKKMLFEKSWNVLLGEDLPLFLYTSWEHIAAGLAKAACIQVKSHYLCEVLFTSLHIWKHFSLRLASVVEKFLSLFIKADWLYFPRLVTCELTTQRGKLDIYNSGAYLQSGRGEGEWCLIDSTRLTFSAFVGPEKYH